MNKSLVGAPRAAAAVASLALVSVVMSIASCSGDGAEPGAASGALYDESSQSNALAAVEWVDGDPPGLEFDKPFNLDVESASRVVTAGDGAEVKPGDNVMLDYVIVDGEAGQTLASTYEGGAPQAYQMTEELVTGDYVWEAINGQRVGAQIIAAFTAPAESADDADAAASQSVTYLLALTIVSAQAIPKRAEGEAVAQDDPSLPTVALDSDGKPSISIPEGVDPPAELVSRLLIKGSGQAVEASQSVVANYTGWLWDGTEFDSSWDGADPATFPLTGVIQGWTDGLTGMPVGSQVLLVIPPDLGYGDEEVGSIPPNSTLIFVVDLLAAS
ncbi:MAG: FKBP-type peptidyl-prolyl cis-trans isomerase [Bifidobacteriaceae bacterium]|nr:FKBP-type peptidyl-prolyl cis-trans isomerase [Bifidobacteriaceae bacterium]